MMANVSELSLSESNKKVFFSSSYFLNRHLHVLFFCFCLFFFQYNFICCGVLVSIMYMCVVLTFAYYYIDGGFINLL